jgi:hypothetical protein
LFKAAPAELTPSAWAATRKPSKFADAVNHAVVRSLLSFDAKVRGQTHAQITNVPDPRSLGGLQLSVIHPLTKPNGNGIVGPNALIRPLVDEYPNFELCIAFAKDECKRSAIPLKKTGLVYDLLKKI